MKKSTKQQRANIVNKSMFYIYKYINTNITLEELAKLNSVSKFHFHRIFKEETNQNIFDFITSIRLQKAANLLITNTHSTISEIANTCGYSSHSSFIKAFKSRFSYTPKNWKNQGHKEYSKFLISEEKEFKNLNYKIELVSKRECAYIRHKGYNRNIRNSWQKLKALAYKYDIKEFTQIALLHDNPTITPLDECNYVAAIEIPTKLKLDISTFEIPQTLCAVFDLKGNYGDVLAFLRYVYHFWLPDSGYEATTLPSFVIYRKNLFFDGGDNFELTFYLPINVIY
ncbi:AraC family transcriptional regulator [Malaciobacter molluscorum LMG 25693]|uniref:AraC family transcriptional regulator n=1 Tax=Malaciobacter molluscorum LMG 25693 TaxID=870501 RepID=A0A2G1DJQ4_9BACT|nr:GyrI-like domain-containing protein [Malaciobacter molluscorum]AXX92877.1 transcriptional regulator, AraC family (GyrI domain) [Malaciobacter molluscorum LMG 25693]PHO18712.1 AraC family transcriptional regulator [Malaciobacter molluscorum LMG 25693]